MSLVEKNVSRLAIYRPWAVIVRLLQSKLCCSRQSRRSLYSMVLEKPIIEKHELMKAIDPIHGRGDSEFDRLRNAGVLSMGVAPESGSQSPASNPHALYCSLNRDVISAVRGGHAEVARELGRHAQRIEQDRIGPWLRSAYETSPPQVAGEVNGGARAWREWLDQAFFDSFSLDADEIVGPVLDAVQDIAEVRDRYASEDPYLRIVVGRIWKIDETFTEVRPEQGAGAESFVVKTEEVFALGLRLGDPVVIRQEELQRGISLTTVERGLEPRRHISLVSGQPMPGHLETLLESSELGGRAHLVPPLRQLA
jgi:hypothetical protein